MSDRKDLLARVQAATGPSRVTDFELHIALVGDAIWPATDIRGRVTNPHSRMSDYLAAYRDVIDDDDQDFDFPRYTASLDAALSLVERALPGCWYIIGKGQTRADEPPYGAQLLFGEREVLGEGESRANLPLALLAALLTALADVAPSGAAPTKREGSFQDEPKSSLTDPEKKE